MRLARMGPRGEERPVVLLPHGEAVDVSEVVRDFHADVYDVENLRELQKAVSGGSAGPTVDIEGQRFGSPISRPGKIICIGLNYHGHIAEINADAPAEPLVFLKAPNAVVGPTDDILIPPNSRHTDWEGELAVVIGKVARYLATSSDAVDCIAGYTISNDVSERTFQLKRGGQFVKGKSCESFNPLGPWVNTSDEIEDPQALDIVLHVNGEPMQNGCTSDMIFSVNEIVHYLSQFMVLEPGDVINTGTPAGVGMARHPRRFLRDGDLIELEVTALGRQEARCRDAI